MAATDGNDEGVKRRKHPRAPIELKVEYRKMNTFFSDFTKNISKGGTFIKTERPLPVGTEFVFKLFVPARDKPFELKGRVVWHNTLEKKQRPEVDQIGMGIRFVYEDPSARTVFESTVEDLMRDSLGDRIYHKLLGEDA
ncbi:MAG: TIGR02266 family protein [Pseudomonadota bacterium]